jgi:hypothetical protein
LASVGARAYIAAMDLKFWTPKLQEAERGLAAAITRAALKAASRRLMRVKAELTALEVAENGLINVVLARRGISLSRWRSSATP